MVHWNSPTVEIKWGQMDGKPEVGQYGTVHETNTDPSMHFRKANTEFVRPVLLPTLNFTSKFTPSLIPNITIKLLHHDKCNIISQVTVN